VGYEIAYIILAHKLPDQFARLVSRLDGADALIIVHVDRKTDIEPFRRALADAGATGSNILLLEDRVAVNWGDYGSVQASLAGLQQALRAGAGWRHAVLLSGQCYPVKRRHQIVEALQAAGDRSFLHTQNTTDFRRLTHYQFNMFGRRFAVPNRFTHGFPPPRKIPLGLQPRKGSAWWALARDAAEWIVDNAAAHPELERFFRKSFIPDENYFQVVSQNAPFADRVINDEVHFLEWEGWHPRTLRAADAPTLIASPKLFARKFDVTVDADVLRELDAYLADPARPQSAASDRARRPRRTRVPSSPRADAGQVGRRAGGSPLGRKI
jgi:hypothetical protein